MNCTLLPPPSDPSRSIAEIAREAEGDQRARCAPCGSDPRMREPATEFQGRDWQWHINETILEGLSEAGERLAQLHAEADRESGAGIEIPEDLGALYRAHVRNLAATLSGGDVVGRAAEELHRVIVCVDVHWQEDARCRRLDLQGDLVAPFLAADMKKAASYEAAGVSLRLIAGTGSRRNLPELKCLI